MVRLRDRLGHDQNPLVAHRHPIGARRARLDARNLLNREATDGPIALAGDIWLAAVLLSFVADWPIEGLAWSAEASWLSISCGFALFADRKDMVVEMGRQGLASGASDPDE